VNCHNHFNCQSSNTLSVTTCFSNESVLHRSLTRSSLVCAALLTEAKLSMNALRCSGGTHTWKDSYSSSEWPFCRPVMRMSDIRFTVSSVDLLWKMVSPCFFLNHFCPQCQAPIVPQNVKTVIITIVPHILLWGCHCQRNSHTRGMSLLTVVAAHHPLEWDQVPPLLIVSNIRPLTLDLTFLL